MTAPRELRMSDIRKMMDDCAPGYDIRFLRKPQGARGALLLLRPGDSLRQDGSVGAWIEEDGTWRARYACCPFARACSGRAPAVPRLMR